MDIKPPNFVFVRGELKVIDLGCAELVAAGCGHVLSTASKGTEGYMAPECFTLTQDRRFVYSVRCSGADMRRVQWLTVLVQCAEQTPTPFASS